MLVSTNFRVVLVRVLDVFHIYEVSRQPAVFLTKFVVLARARSRNASVTQFENIPLLDSVRVLNRAHMDIPYRTYPHL